jgi:protein-tyrosine phosphatase
MFWTLMASRYVTLSQPPSLLLVCTANLCRSPMAAALFAARARVTGYPLRVTSAGLTASVGQRPPAAIIELTGDRGLDLSGHQAQQLTGALAEQHDLVLVMDSAQQRFVERSWRALKGRVCRLGAWRDEDVVDPYGAAEDEYAACFSSIERCVNDWETRWLAPRPERLKLPR